MKYRMIIENINLDEIEGFLNTPLIHAIYRTLRRAKWPDDDNKILLSEAKGSFDITLKKQDEEEGK